MNKRKTDRKEEPKRNTKKLMAIGITLSLVIGFFILVAEFEVKKTVKEDFDMGANANCAVTVEYYGYYEGEVVAIPPIENAPWNIGGQIIDELAVDISWVVTGDYMDWSTLQVAGDLKLYILDYQARNPVDITPSEVSWAFNYEGETSMIQTITYSIPLENLLAGVSPSFSGPDETYWYILAVTDVGAQATDDYDTSHSDSTGEMTATYTIYDEAEVGLTIGGGIT